MLYNSVEVKDVIRNKQINDNLNIIDAKESLMMNKADETGVKADQLLKNMSLNDRRMV